MASKKELQICQIDKQRPLIVPLGATLEELKIAVHLYALELNDWSSSKVAQSFGLARDTVFQYLRAIEVHIPTRSPTPGTVADRVYRGEYTQLPRIKAKRTPIKDEDICPKCRYCRAEKKIEGFKTPELKEVV